ncbi:peptidase [Hydrococcus rivularis NIES-593]|uniref:Peptidase n=1 Tax=Hydrococcus rivularis NIES-593 TaxID=1921803 RepID=A0A1U7HQT4_9CYAN|nr:PepSY domain-containing protein [Hydrococcus rivularis]OKH25946.1 peptidase [Hydrococcus rivularis NIES-593]
MKTLVKIALTATLVSTLGTLGLSGLAIASESQDTNNVQTSQAREEGEQNEQEESQEDDAEEKQEAARLQSLAKITAQQAKQAAETAQGGTASKVELEDEDGNLVYQVVIDQTEVMVDAGNGKVLYTEQANQENEEDETNRPRSSIQVPDTDRKTNDDPGR